MPRPLRFLLLLAATGCPAFGQFTFDIVGSDASQTVTVSASGTVTATSTIVLDPGTRFWNGYGNFWLSTASGQTFTLSSGITLTNGSTSATTGLANVGFNNSANPGDGDIFSFENASSFSVTVGQSLTLTGTATLTLPGSATFSTYFGGYGNFTTSSTRHPFGAGPNLNISASAIPEPSTYAALAGAAALVLAAAVRRRRISAA